MAGFDSPITRAGLKRRLTPRIAQRHTEHGSGLSQFRYVVEGAFSWLFHWRRLRLRYEKRPDLHEALRLLGCAMICWNRIMPFR